MRGKLRAVAFALAPFAVAASCKPIEGAVVERAPRNDCATNACDSYAPGKTAPRCSDVGRCELQSERPLDYRFVVVVHVPDTSFYAPGQTFVVDGSVLDPLVQDGASPTSPTCVAPTCLSLPNLYNARGVYRVSSAAAATLGIQAPDPTAFPATVRFIPLLPASEGTSDQTMTAHGLPFGPLFASPVLSQFDPNAVSATTEAIYVRSIPAGRYLRVMYPEPPFDEFLPPAVATRQPEPNAALTIFDNVQLVLPAESAPGAVVLDDPSGLYRTAGIEREDGLDGFSAWLSDAITGLRISSLRHLGGKKIRVRLDTVGQSAGGAPAVRDNVDVVVAPPEGSIAMPVLRSPLFSGAGLDPIVYPPLPPPASVAGVVAVPTDGGFLGIASELSFDSALLLTKDGRLQPTLHYATSVATDDFGSFSTVLPPGSYDVTITPLEGTGFAKTKALVDVASNVALTLEPLPKTTLTGRVRLSDGRLLSNATVSATPHDAEFPPRPATARTDGDGRFALALDRGAYDLTVQPEDGTGFPWVVVTRVVGATALDVGELTVPVPVPLAFSIHDPSQNSNPIIRAVVRVFAKPADGGTYLEVGRGMTDPDGKCDILLAQPASL